MATHKKIKPGRRLSVLTAKVSSIEIAAMQESLGTEKNVANRVEAAARVLFESGLNPDELTYMVNALEISAEKLQAAADRVSLQSLLVADAAVELKDRFIKRMKDQNVKAVEGETYSAALTETNRLRFDIDVLKGHDGFVKNHPVIDEHAVMKALKESGGNVDGVTKEPIEWLRFTVKKGAQDEKSESA